MKLEDFRRLAEGLVPTQIHRGQVVEDLTRTMAANPWLQVQEPPITFTLEIGSARDRFEIKGHASMTRDQLQALVGEFAERVKLSIGEKYG